MMSPLKSIWLAVSVGTFFVSGPALGWLVKVHRPRDAVNRISNLQVVSNDSQVKVKKDRPRECFVAIELVFKPNGRSLLQNDRALIVPEPGANLKTWKGKAELRLTGVVTELHLIATIPGGNIEEEKIFVTFREWNLTKACSADVERDRPMTGSAVAKPLETQQITPPPVAVSEPVSKETKVPPAPIEAAIREERRFQLSLGLQYYLLKRGSPSLSGPVIALGTRYAFSPRWGAGLVLSQGLELINGLGSAYHSVELGAVFAISGSLMAAMRGPGRKRGHASTDIEEQSSSGFRAQTFFAQYFFTGTSTIPMAGGGLAFHYEFPLSASLNSFMGLKAATVFGDGIPVYLIHVGGGVSLFP